MSSSKITFLIGVVNFGSCCVGLIGIFKFGRRTLMLGGYASMATVLVLTGFFGLKKDDDAMLAFILSFIVFFEFASGPITWLYMAEIMQDKAVSLATVMNWTINLIISAICPPLITAIGDDNVGWIFIVTGCITFMATIFIYFFMKETRGLTSKQIEELFYVDNEYTKKKANAKVIQGGDTSPDTDRLM